MPNLTTAATLQFPAELATEMFNAVRGHSSLARLSAAAPQTFAGNTEFVFSMDGEAEIVGESMQKSPGEADIKPVKRVPIKFVYQHRVPDEFLYLSDEARVPVLQAFAEGFSAKIARGLDIAAFHGINPKTGLASDIVGGNNFDAMITQTAEYEADAVAADDALDEAVNKVLGSERDVSGMAISPLFSNAMAKVKVNGVVQYPEFRFGGNPDSFAGRGLDVNTTVNKKIAEKTERDMAIVGDFARAFRWGYAKDIPLKVIEFGDPDGLGDLQRQNQVVLRSEAYIGWAILDAKSFARVVETVSAGQTS